MKRRRKETKNKDERKIKNKIRTQKSKERNRQNTGQENEWDKQRNIQKEEKTFLLYFLGGKTTLPKHCDSHTEGSKVYVPLSIK